MLKEILIISLLVLAVFVSGCTQHHSTEEKTAGEAAEQQAYNAIEQEMEQAIENITMDDIEQALLE